MIITYYKHVPSKSTHISLSSPLLNRARPLEFNSQELCGYSMTTHAPHCIIVIHVVYHNQDSVFYFWSYKMWPGLAKWGLFVTHSKKQKNPKKRKCRNIFQICWCWNHKTDVSLACHICAKLRLWKSIFLLTIPVLAGHWDFVIVVTSSHLGLFWDAQDQ